MSDLNPKKAHFDPDRSAVIVEHLTVRDRDVAREAQRWTTGERGQIVDDNDALAAADLTNYVTEALRLGAHALSVTGQVQETQALEHMLKGVGSQTADATARAAELTERAVRDASDAVTRAALDAKKAITEADKRNRQEFTTAVAAAKQEMNSELRRIFAGESPELVERLQPVLDKFGTDLDTRVTAGTSELLAKVARQFDPADPTSPMAKHAAELGARQEQLAQQLDRQHAALSHKLEEVSTALKIKEAKAALAQVTPLKGDPYEKRMSAVLVDIASGLGDEYLETGRTVGLLPRCKKGDGVLVVNAGECRIVIEMTDSARSGWNDYLDEAERNRGAVASLGLVRTVGQNNNQTVRVIGPHRVLLAFDPDNDDPDLVRTIVMLLRTMALTTAARTGTDDVATAEEKIAEALAQLTKIDSVKKLSASIQKSATKIDSECTNLNSGIQRLLDEALAALAGAVSAAAIKPSVVNIHDGVA
ncbi:Fis family transcriptional regulator [Nocardia wallacei]|uniref:Fis family transcriptional regulator n=1 Tax=Nocardia wallacei TaxID=480035 RepID=UPI0024551C54|nr:Fis family transcriptional regulator [Nocardia wallacei]